MINARNITHRLLPPDAVVGDFLRFLDYSKAWDNIEPCGSMKNILVDTITADNIPFLRFFVQEVVDGVATASAQLRNCWSLSPSRAPSIWSWAYPV